MVPDPADPEREVIVLGQYEELERAHRYFGDLDDKQLKSVERLADGIVNKLLHDVLTSLKRSASDPGPIDLAEAARLLHQLDFTDDENP